jgi:pimeloyl-ACP methyl ester carboxylesterase
MGKGVLGATDPDNPSLRSLASNTMAAKYTRAAPPLPARPTGQGKGTARAIGDWLPQLLAEHDASASSDPAAYSRLTMPVLLIWGEQDTTTAPSLGQYLARIIPGSRLVPMPGIGHMPPIEDAEAFNRILVEFLAAHWAPAA